MNTAIKKVLNVGGNSKAIAIAEQYNGWEHDLLDIDPTGNPDIVCDARKMHTLPASSYDAVYCSHNLEHYFVHDAEKVLAGFVHVLKPEGYAHIIVPDLGQVMHTVVEKKLDMFDVLYQSQMGPIRVCDVLYGHQGKIAQSGQDYFAHKMGYTKKSLQQLLMHIGFKVVALSTTELNIAALAFMQRPDESVMAQFNITLEG